MFVTVLSLVGGVNYTKGFNHYIDHVSNLLPFEKEKKTRKCPIFALWENSVTEVMFVPGIGNHLKVSVTS